MQGGENAPEMSQRRRVNIRVTWPRIYQADLTEPQIGAVREFLAHHFHHGAVDEGPVGGDEILDFEATMAELLDYLGGRE